MSPGQIRAIASLLDDQVRTLRAIARELDDHEAGICPLDEGEIESERATLAGVASLLREAGGRLDRVRS